MPKLLKQKDMKARNTKTGDVVSNFGISKEFGTVSYIDSKGKVRFSVPHDSEWEIVDEETNTDIYNVRTQAAIAAMQGIITSSELYDVKLNKGESLAQIVANVAVQYADALIEELKKGE